MEYFAGLDVSMAETQICVMGRNGAVIHKAKAPSTPADIAAELAQLPSCRRIVFETGRMAPMLYHGLRQLALPVICVESRQAYQALKLLATHKTDHNDARGLALQASDGIPGLSAAMQGLVAARTALLAAIVAIDGDIRRMVRASDACRRLMSIPGVGQLTALAFTAAVDDPGRFRRSRDIGAYL